MADLSPKNICLNIPFPSAETASLACNVLNVDKELKGRDIITRELSTEGANLVICFHGSDLRQLRVTVNSILKNVLLIVKTISLLQS